jgi:aminoglycoside phosphotransferase family enzyme/predicted kinase
MSDRPAPRAAPTVHETHVSTVFLVGDRAAKLKKPVCFPFLDLSTREARERMCHREVELNRRLSPDVYLGVFDILGPDGSPCDHLVMMRRMPDGRRLSYLVKAGKLPAGALQDLAHVIASFHSRAESSDAIDAEGTRDAVARRWESGFEEIAPLLATAEATALEQEIEARARRYLSGRESIFASRVEEGRVRDGHGDLLADDVFILDDGPRILDCLEFDDCLRYGDTLADIAFLAMDLERLGAPETARDLLAFHRGYSADSYPETLVHHYIALRAHIRAKVEALRAGQGVALSAETAVELLALAASHLRRTRVSLVLVGGAPGTGKSTLAAAIAAELDLVTLRTDEVRKDLAGMGHLERAGAGLDRGIYSEDHTRATYAELLDRAGALLELGESVVLDASWADEEFRLAARELAATTESDLVELRCEVAEEIAARRIQERALGGADPSDVTPEIGAQIGHRFDPWPSAIAIPTDGSRSDAMEVALAAVRDADPIPRPAARGACDRDLQPYRLDRDVRTLT